MNNKILNAIKKAANQLNIEIDFSQNNLNVPFKEIGIDSISGISIIVATEQELGVRIPNNQLSKITNTNQLIKEFEKLIK